MIAYERAGFGASSPVGTQPRDLVHLANDLQRIVEAIPHERLVLVEHSWGGPIVRTLAARLLSQGRTVSGLVLVDQSDEHAAELYLSRTARVSDAIQDALMVPLARLRLLAPLVKTKLNGLSQPLLDAVLAASSSVDAARATSAENHHVGIELRRLQGNPLMLKELGISVISGQRFTRLDWGIRARLVAAHRESTAQHPGAHFVAAEHSGHMIPITEPLLIASEALSFFDADDAQA